MAIGILIYDLTIMKYRDKKHRTVQKDYYIHEPPRQLGTRRKGKFSIVISSTSKESSDNTEGEVYNEFGRTTFEKVLVSKVTGPKFHARKTSRVIECAANVCSQNHQSSGMYQKEECFMFYVLFGRRHSHNKEQNRIAWLDLHTFDSFRKVKRNFSELPEQVENMTIQSGRTT